MIVKSNSEEKKTEKTKEFISSKFDQDEEAYLFKLVLARIRRKYNLSPSELIQLAKEEITIPCSIFTKKLSPLETATKYLKENLGFDYSKIASLLGRDRKSIWLAYKNASKKIIDKFEVSETKYIIPISFFRTNLSILEAAVAYLKDNFRLSYHGIGELLQRNERTIWTVYSRAQKKIAK